MAIRKHHSLVGADSARGLPAAGRDREALPYQAPPIGELAEVCRNRTDRPAYGGTTGFEVLGGHQPAGTSGLILGRLCYSVNFNLCDVLAPAWKGTNFAGLAGATRMKKLVSSTQKPLRA